MAYLMNYGTDLELSADASRWEMGAVLKSSRKSEKPTGPRALRKPASVARSRGSSHPSANDVCATKIAKHRA